MVSVLPVKWSDRCSLGIHYSHPYVILQRIEVSRRIQRHCKADRVQSLLGVVRKMVERFKSSEEDMLE